MDHADVRLATRDAANHFRNLRSSHDQQRTTQREAVFIRRLQCGRCRRYTRLGHQVVANFSFNGFGAGNVDLVLMGAQIGYLFGRDQTSLLLRFRQRHPKAAQQAALFGLAPNPAHHLAAIAPSEGG